MAMVKEPGTSNFRDKGLGLSARRSGGREATFMGRTVNRKGTVTRAEDWMVTITLRKLRVN